MTVKTTLKREIKKDELKARLVESATRRIRESGLLSLRARDVTQDAGCALGALYTVFADLDALILEVSAQTLARLDASVAEAVSGSGDPGARLKFLGQRYLAFASENNRLWRALFEHHPAHDKPFPQWHLDNQARLLAHIAGPLRQLQPQLDDQQLMIRARTLFAAVHGIVWVSLDNRFVGLPAESLPEELDRFISLLLEGLNVGPPQQSD